MYYLSVETLCSFGVPPLEENKTVVSRQRCVCHTLLAHDFIQFFLAVNRIESYSCKMAGQDKRLFKLLSRENGEVPGGLQALSPPQSMGPTSHSPGRLVLFFVFVYFHSVSRLHCFSSLCLMFCLVQKSEFHLTLSLPGGCHCLLTSCDNCFARKKFQ